MKTKGNRMKRRIARCIVSGQLGISMMQRAQFNTSFRLVLRSDLIVSFTDLVAEFIRRKTSLNSEDHNPQSRSCPDAYHICFNSGREFWKNSWPSGTRRWFAGVSQVNKCWSTSYHRQHKKSQRTTSKLSNHCKFPFSDAHISIPSLLLHLFFYIISLYLLSWH